MQINKFCMDSHFVCNINRASLIAIFYATGTKWGSLYFSVKVGSMSRKQFSAIWMSYIFYDNSLLLSILIIRFIENNDEIGHIQKCYWCGIKFDFVVEKKKTFFLIRLSLRFR